MKKLSVLCLAFALIVALGSAAMASTIKVNPESGVSISLDKNDLSQDPYTVSGNFGITKQMQLNVGYQPEITKDGITEDATTYLGVRYGLKDNMAVTVDYNSTVAWQAGFRAKYNTSEKFALAGKADYNWTGAGNYYKLTGNAEYAFNKMFTGNIGMDYTGFEGADPKTGLLLGTEFNFGKTSMYFDTWSPSDNILKKGSVVYSLGLKVGL